jgi:hypothetical protein
MPDCEKRSRLPKRYDDKEYKDRYEINMFFYFNPFS